MDKNQQVPQDIARRALRIVEVIGESFDAQFSAGVQTKVFGDALWPDDPTDERTLADEIDDCAEDINNWKMGSDQKTVEAQIKDGSFECPQCGKDDFHIRRYNDGRCDRVEITCVECGWEVEE